MKICYKIVLITALIFSSFCTTAAERANIYKYSRDLPKKELTGSTGNKITLDDFRDNFTIAVFWSRYCIPCLRELKSLSRFAAKTKNDGIRVIMISPKSEWIGGFDEQKQFLHNFEADNLEIYVDEREAVASAFGIFSSPVSILISRNSQEIGRIRGSINWNTSEVIEYIYKIKAEKG